MHIHNINMGKYIHVYNCARGHEISRRVCALAYNYNIPLQSLHGSFPRKGGSGEWVATLIATWKKAGICFRSVTVTKNTCRQRSNFCASIWPTKNPLELFSLTERGPPFSPLFGPGAGFRQLPLQREEAGIWIVQSIPGGC